MTRLLDVKIKSYSFLLVAHYATFAYQDLLYEYLTKHKSKSVTKMNFPLPDLPLLTKLEIITKTNQSYATKETRASPRSPKLFAYIYQAIQYVYIGLTSGKAYDYIIAEDSLLAFCSLVLKFFGKCRYVIFYSHGIDFTRFQYAWANKLYQHLDAFSAQHSDYNWFLGQNMIPIRIKQGVHTNRMFWVPSSIPITSLPIKTTMTNHKLVFLGVINDKNGVGILPSIINTVRKTIPDVSLDIMGEGDMKNELIQQVKHLKLTKNVRFLGNLEFHKFKNLLTYYRVGIVPYKFSTTNLIPTSDSMKMRVYLAAGLPILVTKGFIFSDEVIKEKLGYAVPYEEKAFAQKLIILLSNQKLSDGFRTRALNYSKKMDLTTIYNSTFDSILR